MLKFLFLKEEIFSLSLKELNLKEDYSIGLFLSKVPTLPIALKLEFCNPKFLFDYKLLDLKFLYLSIEDDKEVFSLFLVKILFISLFKLFKKS